jgi:tetratricopeptide (TPR) repeat protein
VFVGSSCPRQNVNGLGPAEKCAAPRPESDVKIHSFLTGSRSLELTGQSLNLDSITRGAWQRSSPCIESANVPLSLLAFIWVASNPPQQLARQSNTVSIGDLRIPADARKQYEAGVAATRTSDWQKAHDAFREALRVHSNYARAHNALGVVLVFMRRSVTEIESEFRSAILFDPKLVDAHFNLGKLLLESSRPVEAKHELQRVLELDKRHWAAGQLLAESMLLTNDEGSAAMLMRSMHELRVQHPVSLHIEIGARLESQGMFDLATEQYQFTLADDSSAAERRSAETALSRLRRRN